MITHKTKKTKKQEKLITLAIILVILGIGMAIGLIKNAADDQMTYEEVTAAEDATYSQMETYPSDDSEDDNTEGEMQETLSSSYLVWSDYYIDDNGYIIVSADSSYDISDLGIDIEYSGDKIAEINENVPFFTEEEITTEYFIQLTELDSLGRAGSASMCASEEYIQTGERGDISNIHPSGWYSGADANRSHLLMWKLSGCDDEKNLITGTASFNQDSMLEYESKVTALLYDDNDIHVMYRVTPYFYEDEVIARGVLMEAYSVEDDGASLSFCVFVYNVSDDYDLDYENGGYYW